MSGELFSFIYLSELIDLPILSTTNGRKLGRIIDLAANTAHTYPRVTGLIAKMRSGGSEVYIPWANVRIAAFKKQISVEPDQLAHEAVPASEREILVKKTFLDKQIISTSGFKLVRVNDLQLLIDNAARENPNLWLVHIDIGFKGLLRRLGWLPAMNAIVHWLLAHDMKDKFVPWKFVQPTSTTNVYGAVELNVDSSRLVDVHPADIADVLEELGTDERVAFIESLEPATAAASLQEMQMNLQLQIAESLDTKTLAGIINEMELDEAVDLLDELDVDKRNEIYAVLVPEKVLELRELSKLSKYSAGSIMNTNFITVPFETTVKEALKMVKKESTDSEIVYYAYVLDDAGVLKGVLTLRQLLSSKASAKVAEVMIENVIAVPLDTNIKRVAQLFYKYDFIAVPVVDAERKLQGIISMRDALKSVIPEMRQESGD